MLEYEGGPGDKYAKYLWHICGCRHYERRKHSISSSLLPMGTAYTEGREKKCCLYKASSEDEQGMDKKGWAAAYFFYAVEIKAVSPPCTKA